jgi:hypothetical protein
MKVKLIKDHSEYMLINDERFVIATTDASMLEVTDKMKLSKQNCDEIFGVVDLMKLAEENSHKHYDVKTTDWHCNYNGFFSGFQKSMELNKDKVFTIDDIDKAIEWATVNGRKGDITHYDIDNFIQSRQQPTEIEVEIEMKKVVDKTKVVGLVKGVKGSGDKITTYRYIPSFDTKKCLILKKI